VFLEPLDLNLQWYIVWKGWWDEVWWVDFVWYYPPGLPRLFDHLGLYVPFEILVVHRSCRVVWMALWEEM